VAHPNYPKLTRREQEIMLWILRGLTSKEIALELSASPRTIDTHMSNILLKTGARNRVNMAARVILAGLSAVSLQDVEWPNEPLA
jgi:DNA-binding CsgD family transcriptional regulator